MVDWTEAEDDLLRHLTSRNLSAGQIAAQMPSGRTRNAVIGRWQRIGIKVGHKRKPKSLLVKPTPDVEKSSLDTLLKRLKERAKSQTKTTKQPLRDGEPNPLMLSLPDLERNMCRFPFGDVGEDDFGFCGHRTLAGRPYCPYHHQVSISKPVYRFRKAA